jgi:hypothetical protein
MLVEQVNIHSPRSSSSNNSNNNRSNRKYNLLCHLFLRMPLQLPRHNSPNCRRQHRLRWRLPRCQRRRSPLLLNSRRLQRRLLLQHHPCRRMAQLCRHPWRSLNSFRNSSKAQLPLSC